MVPGALATLVVFLLIGIWHTASWNAVIYGAYFGLVMAASMLLDPVWKTMRTTLKLPKGSWMTPLRLIRTWLLILLAQYFAFTLHPEMGFSLLKGTFGTWTMDGFAAQTTAVMAPLEWIIIGTGCLIVLIIDLMCEKNIDVCGRLAKTHFYLRWLVLLVLILAIVTFGVYGSGYDGAAFLYTQF